MKFYSYNKCGTCRKAKKYLEEKGIAFKEFDITETAPPKTLLKQAIAAKGLKKLFNTSGVVYKEMKLKDKVATMSEKEALELLSSNGRLVKRPFAVDGDRVTIGFQVDEYDSVWASGK